MSKDASLKPGDAGRSVDYFSKAVDKIHDKIATADGHVSLAISTAQKAMAGVTMEDVMAMTPRECLIPLKRVMDALNAVKGVHPFVGIAVTAFEVLLTLEMKRRENDKRVSGILLKQGDMMMALLQLENVKDVDMKNEKGESVAGRLQTLIAEIKRDINKCGNVIDTYYKQKFLAKFFRAASWENKFMGFANAFDKRKEEIKFALEIHVTIKLDTVADQVSSIDIKMDMLIHLFKDQSPKEKELAAEVEQLGGIEACMHNEGLLAKLDHDKSSREKISTSLLVSLRTPLETLIENNKAYFDLKMEAQTKQIDVAIQRSTRKIIKAIGLRERPWRRILDPDIREVWKNMHAPSSVKARYFVLALHDYYLDRYENIGTSANGISDETMEITVTRPTSPAISHADSEGADADIALQPPDEEDKWCLQFLSIQTVSPIAAAIDEDVSGFIKIAEVNWFYNDKPQSFSMLRWVTFWAEGWAVEASIYHIRIEALMEKLLDVVVMPENATSFANYADTLLWIPWLLRSQSHTTTESPELIDLVHQHMRIQEDIIIGALEPAKWEIDAPDTISTLLGPGRIEKFLYPVLYLVLRYHYQVFSHSAKHVLDNREFEAAWTTLWSILSVCNDRTITLSAFFMQRRGDEEFKTFAKGLFNNWYTANPFKKSFSGSEHPDLVPPFTLPDGEYAMEDHDTMVDVPQLEIGKLHYGLNDATNRLDETDDHRAFIELMKKQLRLQYAGDVSIEKDTEKIVEFERILGSGSDTCHNTALCEFNRVGVHQWVCDGCGMYPILGIHYQCIGCYIDGKKLDFDLCQNCVIQIPAKPAGDCSRHRSSHPMNRFPHCTGKAIRIRSREKAVELVRKMAKEPNTVFTCNGPCGKVGAHGLHFRCVQCEEYILCADCVFHETKEGAGHRPTHVFARFTGEPLPFKEDKEESEISRPAGTAKIETVLDKFDERLANQEKIMKSLAEQLEKQERLIQSLVDASSRDKGVEIVQHQDNAPL